MRSTPFVRSGRGSKSELTATDYEEFYKFIGHDIEPPLYRFHFSADAPLAINALLFVPKNSHGKAGHAEDRVGSAPLRRKILIQSKSKGLLPDWLRFLRGVVDSEDLPLNISRETMQDSALLQKLNRVLSGRFLKFLEEEAKTDADEISPASSRNSVTFSRKASSVISPIEIPWRSCCATRLRNRKPRSASPTTSRGCRRSRRRSISFPRRIAKPASASPYLEALRAKNYEALFLFDPWDEFCDGPPAGIRWQKADRRRKSRDRSRGRGKTR